MEASYLLLIITAIMALSATTFSALTMAFQRSHSRKSVRPFCNILESTAEDEISIMLQNAGLGPMILRRVVLLESTDDSIENGKSLKDVLPAATSAGLFLLESENYTLGTMQQTVLFRYPPGLLTNPKAGINRRWLCIEYDDVYDHRYEKRQGLRYT